MAKGFVVLQRIQSGKAMLVRIVVMLTKLLERFDPEQFRVRARVHQTPLSYSSTTDEHD